MPLAATAPAATAPTAAQLAASQAAAAQLAASRAAAAETAASARLDMPAPETPPAQQPLAAEVGADLFANGSEFQASSPTQVADDRVVTTEETLPQRIAGPAIEMYHSDTYSDSPGALRPLSPDEVELRLALHRVGFDLELIEHIEKVTAQSSLESALREVFESLTPPPRMPRRGGSLIVVVGAGRHAATAARRLAA